MWARFEDNNLDLYFYVQNAQTREWHNLFMNPDVLSKNEVEAHEDYLRQVCPHASKNLDALKLLLMNLCATELIEVMSVYSEDSDGGIISWINLNKMLQGYAMSKIMRYQETFKNMMLVDYPGLCVTKYHKILLPA